MRVMNGLTAKEIGEMLGLLPDTVKKRLKKYGVKPVEYAGPTALYPESAVKSIKDSPSPGRPPKKKPENKKPKKDK